MLSTRHGIVSDQMVHGPDAMGDASSFSARVVNGWHEDTPRHRLPYGKNSSSATK
jgi:hypothetical protein